jgi:hypothetical protein
MRGPALIVSLFLSTGANAMTGTEFLDKMNDQQRAAYVEGVLDMLAYGLPVPQAKCLQDWYYEGDGPRQLIRAVHQRPDLPVQGVLQVLSKRLC